MALAGLWDQWRSKDKSETKETFTIVTTEPSKVAAQFHNRMPLVLESNTWEDWLRGDPETAASLLKPANEVVLVSRPVNKALGNVARIRLCGSPANVSLHADCVAKLALRRIAKRDSVG